MVKVMRADRTVVEISADFMATQGRILGWVMASDGLWVPSCDLSQYEAGRRPIKE